jgi:hypothetical protein
MRQIWISLCFSFLVVWVGEKPAGAGILAFDQLNWEGLASSTPDSSWGRVRFDFLGYSDTMYFNLNVDGQWVVQNMGIVSLYGTGVNQSVSTTFDLGVANGTNVSSLNYLFQVTAAPLLSMPFGSLVGAMVNDVNYQIGGEGGVDLGTPAAPEAPTGGNAAEVTMSAKLPNIDKFVNQPQGRNECAPGAISNSLKYLQATGQLANNIPTDISDIKPIIGTTPTGSPSNWPTLKGDHFRNTILTKVLTPDEIKKLIDAVNAGKDVELDLAGHVAVIAGVRKYSNGRIELDIFDDNQIDNLSDPLRTVEIKNGKVEGKSIDGFVVESAVPEPGTLTLAGLGVFVLVAGSIRRRRQQTVAA